MASNELAAILARRRAKAGEAGDAPGTPAVAALPAAAASPGAGADAKPKSSIAERIARLKAQSAAAAAAGDAAPTPMPIQLNRSPASPAGNSEANGSASSAESPVSNRRASDKIQQLQGNLGINVNPFGRPGGPRRTGTGGSSIMTTGDQYAHTHGMGIAMPGMGAAIPMPGLAKAGTRIPGMASEGAETSELAPEVEHATMTRAAAPKRRGPTRGPPPGAFRIPGVVAPLAAPGSEQSTQEAAVSPPIAPPAMTTTWSEPAAPTPFTPTPALTPADQPRVEAAELFGSRPTAAVAEAAAAVAIAPTPLAPTPQAIPAPVLHEPTPLPQPVMFTPPVAEDATWQPTFTKPPSLFDNFSEEELTMGGLSIDDVAVVKKAEPYSASLFGAAPTLAATPTPTTAPAPAPTPPPVTRAASPPPVSSTPSPVAAPSPAVVSTPPPEAPSSSPPPAASKNASTSMLFGPASGGPDDSSDSDWSDNEDSKKPAPALFGAPVPQPSTQMAAAPTPAPQAAAPAPAPVLVTPPAPTMHSAPPPSEMSSLFGSTGADASSAQPVAFANAPERSAIAPPPRAAYASLFAAGASSSSDSDSDSDEEGGLFGTGLPTKR